MKMGSNNSENNPSANPSSLQLVPVQSTGVAGALTSPASSQSRTDRQVAAVSHTSSGHSSRLFNPSRQPRNLQGLLKFALEATQAEDAPGNTEIGPMDEQRRKFLEEALRSLTVNVSEVLDNALKVLTNTEKISSIKDGEPLPDEVKNSFTVLLDHVDDLDVANDFNKMGGFAMFPICYSSVNEEVRARTSSVLGTLCQNNPFCQTKALECGLLHVLLNLMQTEKGNTLAKCLYAISCVSREFDPACRELIAQDGCQILVQILNSDAAAARTKAAFLIRYYCQHYTEARKQFIRHNIVKVIVEQIRAGRDESTEHLLSILQVLVSSDDPAIIKLVQDPQFDLKKVLETHLTRPELEDDRFKEEIDYCNELLIKLFSTRSDLLVEKADR